jgi:hypothetical protein
VSVLSNTIWGGTIGLAFALACWRRKEEIDSDGNLCLRYFGPRYAIPLTAVTWIGIGLYHLHDPMYERHPENFYFLIGLAALSVLASIHFVLYRITLREKTIERVQWPLKPRQYSLDELTLIGEKRRQTILHFRGGDTLTIQLLLSGQPRFIERMQTLWVSRVISGTDRSTRPGRRSS